ncbi:hypothetical protein GS458_1559 [Geobacillus stearothermophilus]|nr:hypothetical protein GS458_1559 [Geobacillus stearothermophilus]
MMDDKNDSCRLFCVVAKGIMCSTISMENPLTFTCQRKGAPVQTPSLGFYLKVVLAEKLPLQTKLEAVHGTIVRLPNGRTSHNQG